MLIRIAQNMGDSNFWENFSGRKYRKYTGNCRFCRFSLDFFLTFRCFFHWNIIYNNFHHQAWLNCQYNWFLLPELSKNPRNSRFSPEKWHFLNFSGCTLYFFIKFCTLIRNGNAQKVMESDFVKTFFLAESCHFFPAENVGIMPEIAAFAVFHLTFFL